MTTQALDIRQLKVERMRRRLFSFLLATSSPAYNPGWIHREICAHLDQFLQGVVEHTSPRLMIFTPPRHGKSEIASRKFPAYALGRYPDLSVVATSYSASLASAMNRDVQRAIDTPAYQQLFPATRLAGMPGIRTADFLRNNDEFEIANRAGIYKCAGVGGSITGRGADIAIVDDPIKDAAQAHSDTERDAVWDWYQSTLYTRLQPGGGIVLIMTRWHEDDLAGRLLEAAKHGGDQWTVLSFPAIAEHDEHGRLTGDLLRKEGEALHEARYSMESLKRIEKAVGSRVWASLFQQRPAAASGTIFKREHWGSYKLTSEDPRKLCQDLGINRIVIGVDTAMTAKTSGDYSAFVALGVSPKRYYVLDLWKERQEFPEVKRQLEAFYSKWRGAASCEVCIEGGGSHSGKIAAQELGRETPMPIREVPNTTDKMTRAMGVTPLTEAGTVLLPEGVAWTSDFINSLASFPAAKHDDDVDAFCIALERAARGSSTGLLDFYRELLSDEERARIDAQMAAS